MFSKILSALIRLGFLGALFVLLFFPEQTGISFSYALAPLADHVFLRLCKTVVWLLIGMELLRIFYYVVVKGKSKGVLANFLTIVFPLIFFLIFLECVFMFIAQSQEGVLTKASQIWWDRYWKPINSLGYRDAEPAPQPGKKQVIVIGDSFTAGHGLESVSERFSDQLGVKLGDGYQVYNLGVSGSDTGDEARRLEEFPVKPDLIVLQYFPNDIERVAQANGLTITAGKPYDDLGRISTQLVNRFYLPNFIYWQVPHAQFSTFDEFVTKAYSDSTVLQAHFADLQKIIDYGQNSGADIVTVFVPFLFMLEKSEEYTRPVRNYLSERGVKVVTLEEQIGRIPEKERVVGRNDGHASTKVNTVIAEELFKAIRVN